MIALESESSFEKTVFGKGLCDTFVLMNFGPPDLRQPTKIQHSLHIRMASLIHIMITTHTVAFVGVGIVAWVMLW